MIMLKLWRSSKTGGDWAPGRDPGHSNNQPLDDEHCEDDEKDNCFVENYDDYSGHFGSQLLDDESCEKYTDGEGDRG